MNDMLTKRRCRDEAFHLLLPWTLRHSPVQDAIEVVLLHGVLAKAVRVFGRIHEYKKKKAPCVVVFFCQNIQSFCTVPTLCRQDSGSTMTTVYLLLRTEPTWLSAHLSICPLVDLAICPTLRPMSPSHVPPMFLRHVKVRSVHAHVTFLARIQRQDMYMAKEAAI